MTREDNLQTISNLVSESTCKKILDKNYSDSVIEYISGYAPTIEIFAQTRYKAGSVEKLKKLVDEGMLDDFDMIELMKDSITHNRNECYIDKLVEILNIENHHDIYASFRTSNATDVSFDDIIMGIHQGVFEANIFGMVHMNKDLAKQMDDLGISLLLCEDYDYYSDLLDFNEAYNEDSHTFIPVQRYRLAVAIKDMCNESDWKGFKDYLISQMSDNMDKLTPYILNDMKEKYDLEKSMGRLADKIAHEYNLFITDIKSQSPDAIVEAAYEIVTKDDINEFCSSGDYSLTQNELDVLISADELLDRLYRKWEELSAVHSLYNMGTMLEEAAYDIKTEKKERSENIADITEKTELKKSKKSFKI